VKRVLALMTFCCLVSVSYGRPGTMPPLSPHPRLALAAAAPVGRCDARDSSFLGGGGPDSFGYRYLDSDTACPGSPAFNWVGIKGVGTEITTLGDDNDAGPFRLGFEFPYYGYRVSSCYVGANGLVAFHEHALEGTPFETIPNPWPPNNILAPIMCDLDCSHSGSPHGSVWYWTSATTDTFIVEYDSIEFWSSGGNNTFEIILSRPDSTITFQYKEQLGEPYGGWVNNQTGIENVSGTIGLLYLIGQYPPQNTYHDSLAVRFIPPDSSGAYIHEVGAGSQRGTKAAATVCRHLTPGAVIFDATGRRALNPRTGVYFVRERPNAASRQSSAVPVRKVVVTR